MAFKNKVVIAASCIIAASSIQCSYAQQQAISYNRSVFSNYKSLPVNQAAVTATEQSVQAQFPGWAVIADKVDGMFTDIYGIPVSLPGTNNSDNAQYCMTERLNTSGIQKDEWKQVSDISAPKANYINYTREISGHPVVFSRLSFRFTKTGELAEIQMKNYGTPANILPLLTADDAKKAATDDLRDFKNTTITSADISGNWSWFPVPSANGYALRPSWGFTISGTVEDNPPFTLTGYVDAINGAILYRTNEVKETNYDLTVKGMVYKNGTTNPATLEALPDINLRIGATTYITDTSGFYATVGLSLPQYTTIPLQGKWSTVYNYTPRIIPSFIDTVTLAGSVYVYPTTSPSSSRHVNAYYHVNRVHNFMKQYYPTFTGMDTSLRTNVDVTTGKCNAFYNGSSINFYSAGGGCVSFAEMGDVIYHEYGHGISDHFYRMVTGSTIMNGALNEANSDIWALSITHDPVLARNAFVPYGGFIRRYDRIPQVYPMDLQGIDVHKDGQIIAGCWWDVGVNIGSVDSMTKIFTDVYYDAPDGPDGTEGAIYQFILIHALMADDNDANLTNGTPHYAQIVAAFAKHGIYLEGDAALVHTELPNQPAGSPITITATLNASTHTYFHDLMLYYRVNSTGAWAPVTLTGSSFTFTGSIPAQPGGIVVEYYFIAHDNMNVPNAYFPITCNATLPANQATIPYQFGVGIQAIDSMNFDGATTGWGISANPGDDATAGLWHLAIPHGTNNMWPSGDHSHHGGSCVITGKETDTTGVRSGTSTVLSPVFNISGFTTPVVEYYRWFSNDWGTKNFKDDPWIVKIRDASGATWQTVENTYQGDDNWRRRIFPVKAYLPASAASIQLQFFASDSVVSTVGNNGQSKTVSSLDDVFIYDKASPLSVNNNGPVRAEIFPVPADNRINIVFPVGNKGVISLYNIAGRLVAEINMEQNKASYSISAKELAAGQYNLVIQTSNNIQSKKIVVIHQ